MKKQKTFILQEAKHVSCGLIYLNELYFSENLYFSDTESNNIDRLSEIMDIYFIFPNNLCKKINPNKFSSLYNAKGYTILPDDQEVPGTINLIDYLINIIGRYINMFYISNIDILEDFDSLDDLVSLQLSQLKKSIFTISRLSPKQLSEIYTEIEPNFIQKYLHPELVLNGMFSTHSSPDEILYIKLDLFKQILEKISKVYIKTFDNYTFETFISSTVNRFGLKDNLINYSINDVIETNRQTSEKEEVADI